MAGRNADTMLDKTFGRIARSTKRRRGERQVRDAIDSLSLPPGWKLDDLSKLMETRRGRKLRLIPFAAPCPGENTIYGLWLETADDDMIMYRSDTSEYHQLHIVCHELGHMLLGHRCDEVRTSDYVAAVAALSPDLDVETVEAVLARSSCATEREWEAELAADLLMEKAAYSHLNGGEGLNARLESVLWGR